MGVSFLMVKADDLLERVKSPQMLLIGPNEPFEQSIGLWTADVAERMVDGVLVEIPLKLGVETRTVTHSGVYKFTAGIGDDL